MSAAVRWIALVRALAVGVALFSTLVGPGLAFAQDTPVADQIIWSEDRPLTWADFKALEAVGKRMGEFDASVESGITGVEWTCTPANEFRFSGAQAYFDPNASWLRSNMDYDKLLAHEQGHFDITEIHARKLRQELRAVSCVGRSLQEVSRDVEAARQRIAELEDAEQTRYDDETGHGMSRNTQQSWQTTIRMRLAATRGQ